MNKPNNTTPGPRTTPEVKAAASRKYGKGAKARRREEAEVRNAARAERSVVEQMVVLENRGHADSAEYRRLAAQRP